VVSIAIRGLIRVVKENIRFDCHNLAALARKLSSMVAQVSYAYFNKP
jgi:hypothetical protein